MFCFDGLAGLGFICSTLKEEKDKWIGLGGVMVDRVPAGVYKTRVQVSAP